MIRQVYTTLFVLIIASLWYSAVRFMFNAPSDIAFYIGVLMLPAFLLIPRLYRFGMSITFSKQKP